MSRDVEVIGAPYGAGGVDAGCELGPAAVRHAGLAEHVYPRDHYVERTIDGYRDRGDVAVDFEDECTHDLAELIEGATVEDLTDPDRGYARNLGGLAQVWDAVADTIADSVERGAVPLVVGGDHAVAPGTVRGMSREAEVGVLWFDAHGDFNTPLSSPSGYVHGMPLAVVLGRGPFAGRPWATAPNVHEENVVVVGLRDLDHHLPDWIEASETVDASAVGTEAQALAESQVTTMTMADIDARGIGPVVEEALDVASDGVDDVHVSVDMDWLDAGEVPGVGTPVAGGVTRREARLAIERIADRDAEEGILRSVEFVEVNPLLDDANRTAELAAHLAGVVFGGELVYEGVESTLSDRRGG